MSRKRRRLFHDLLAVVSLVAFGIACHWQIIVGDQLPVGGDKASFTLGLMATYGEALRAGSLPVWNGLWGLGFPSLAESQTGVFYPPHLILYSLLDPSDGFHASYLLHRLLAIVLGYVSFRGLRLRPLGAWSATLVYAFGGFAIVHLDHQWGVESMVWLPPIVALTSRWLHRRSRWAWALLPWLVALQLTIGHFQIAFMTTVTAALYALFWFAKRQRVRYQRPKFGTVVFWLCGIGLGYGLAAMQLLPTFLFQQFLRQDGALQGDYLATHALPPWMLLQPIFPYLYFRDPLWRSVVWTPIVSAPEECLQFMGLVPLVFAAWSLKQIRRDGRVGIWLGILGAAMLLSIAPFLPGYSLLTSLPGFSFFRASARWTLVTHLAIGVLSGIGVDRLRSSRKLLHLWVVMTAVTMTLALLIASFWVLIDRSARENRPIPTWLSYGIDTLVPSKRQPLSGQIPAEYGKYQRWDTYTWKAWMRLERPDTTLSLLDRIRETAQLELLPTGITIGLGLLTFGLIARIRRQEGGSFAARAAIVGLCLFEFAFFRILFPETSVPRKELQSSGPVMQALRELPRGSRIIGPGGNFLMTFGLAPVPAYRTLDIPLPPAVMRALAATEESFPRPLTIPDSDPRRLLGIAAVLRAPLLTPANQPPPKFDAVVVVEPGDPLAAWLEGPLRLSSMLSKRGLRVQAALLKEPAPEVSALVVSSDSLGAQVVSESTVELSGLYSGRLPRIIGRAVRQSTTGDSRRWKVDTSEPGYIVIGEMLAPGWNAQLFQDGETEEIPVLRVDKYWQGIAFSRGGTFELKLDFTPPGLRAGLGMAISALIGWLGMVAMLSRAKR